MHARQTFEAWQDPEGDTTFATSASISELRTKRLLSDSAVLLYSVEASSWEEAMAVHHLRMGYEPYKPLGKPAPCSNCGALVYVEGSGQCWRCSQLLGAA
jgi:hypothetical protein